MGELSFLTIIVSLAVCSLLIYAVFQYMKVRLTILEQSHKEQALILQQFIEESSTDIHRLYQMKSGSNFGGNEYQGSIILEYANEKANANHAVEVTEKPVAYNEPHMIHLDTAIFQNKHNLIEISSDSEDTTDSDSDSECESEGSECDVSDSESEGSEGSDSECSEQHVPVVESEVSTIEVEPIEIGAIEPEIKMVTVDLGVQSSPEKSNDVLSLLNKHAQQNVIEEQPESAPATVPAPAPAPAPASAPAVTPVILPPVNGMSVPELRYLLKEVYKSQPEKHAEIQKMKKTELIQALQLHQHK